MTIGDGSSIQINGIPVILKGLIPGQTIQFNGENWINATGGGGGNPPDGITITLNGSSQLQINPALISINATSGNVTIGSNCLTAITTGQGNFAAGLNSLTANTTGNGNIAIGYDALAANTTASSNTAVGVLALAANTTGTPNSAFGAGALQSNTTGTDNVAVGYNVMHADTTGVNNTVIGTGSMQNKNSITGVGDNVVIGYGSGNNYTAEEANNIIIGDSVGGIAAESYAFHLGNSIADLLTGVLPNRSNAPSLAINGKLTTAGSVSPGSNGTQTTASHMFSGTGAPSSLTGMVTGDFYFRVDGTHTQGTYDNIYNYDGANWVGIA